MSANAHAHDRECFVLARARLRVLRSEIAFNQAVMRAQEEHTARLVQIVVDLERNTIRLNMNDVIRSMPSLTPPGIERRTPLRDITNTVHNRNDENRNPTETQTQTETRFPFTVYEDIDEDSIDEDDQ
jgi:hypothetical protein